MVRIKWEGIQEHINWEPKNTVYLGGRLIIHAMHLSGRTRMGSEPWDLELGGHCDLDQWTGEGESLPGLGSMEKGEE